MKKSGKNTSDLLEEASILMESVDYFNKKMNDVVSNFEKISSKSIHSISEVKKMERLDNEMDDLSRRLDIEYAAIERMEGKIEEQLILNNEKKKKLKKRSKKKTKEKKPKKSK